ncbi:MAG: hypothetical protein R2991_09225 [Thermoanaerobaculia bacterium]
MTDRVSRRGSALERARRRHGLALAFGGVNAYTERESFGVETDEAGEAVLEGLARGEHLLGSVWHESFDDLPALDVPIPVSGEVPPVVIRFEPRVRRLVDVIGRLVDADGAPIAGEQLRTEEVTRHAAGFHEAVTPQGSFRLRIRTEHGRYEYPEPVEIPGQAPESLVFAETLTIEGVPPGRYAVEIAAPDGRTWTTEGEVRDATRRTALAW